MRYFYDTEFHERGPAHPIELISFGIVSEEGRELYLINTDFDWDDPKHSGSPSIDWLRENAMPHILKGDELDRYGLPFNEFKGRLLRFIDHQPELWGYFSAYDHMMLSQIFGRMVDLPRHWRHTMDLQQVIRSMHLKKSDLPLHRNEGGVVRHRAIDDARWVKDVWEYIFRGDGPLSQDLPFIEGN